MSARTSLLVALAVAMAASAGLAAGVAEAQPFGRGLAMRVAEGGRERREAHREERGGGERGGGERRDYRQGYAPPAYGPAPAPPRAYPYPAPAYPYGQRAAPPQGYPAAPPPPAYSYAPSPQGPGRNSLGAYWGQQQEDARRGVRQGNMPLHDVTANIRRSVPGRMLDAGLEAGPGGRPAYRVRWAAANGRRIDFIVDAATGAIIGQNGY